MYKVDLQREKYTSKRHICTKKQNIYMQTFIFGCVQEKTLKIKDRTGVIRVIKIPLSRQLQAINLTVLANWSH